MSNYEDPGLRLTPRGKRVAIAVIVIGVLLLFTLALTDHVGAADSSGNRGGCAEGNKWRGLSCVITDFTPGYVSGTCDGGLWFADERTARTWRIEMPVTAQGCEYEDWRISGAPGWPFRLSK
jgi:hypothetical protein